MVYPRVAAVLLREASSCRVIEIEVRNEFRDLCEHTLVAMLLPRTVFASEWNSPAAVKRLFSVRVIWAESRNLLLNHSCTGDTNSRVAQIRRRRGVAGFACIGACTFRFLESELQIKDSGWVCIVEKGPPRHSHQRQT